MATKTQPKKPPKAQAPARVEKPQRKIEPEVKTAEATPASDQAGEPVCPRHQGAAEVERTDGYFAHYRCPNPECKFTTKRPLPRLKAKLERENDQQRFEAR